MSYPGQRGRDGVKINRSELKEQNGEAQIGAVVEYANSRQYLWYRVNARYGHFLTTERMDGFVVALLPLAMITGEDLYIDGAMSEKLYYNLTNYYMRILCSVIPSLRSVRIVPAQLDSGRTYQSEGGVATGFSGGIDSFCVVADHLRDDIPSAFRITHFIFNNVGAFGKAGTRPGLFHDRYTALSGFPSEAQIDFVKIDSNLDDILPTQVGYVMTITLRNVSAVLMLQKLFSKYLYASSYKYEDCFVGPTNNSGYSDPFTVHLLSTETLECISVGCQYSRAQKTIKVADFEPSRRYLNVCASNKSVGNCSTCWKCARTLLTLEILGKEGFYEGVFDLNAYHRIREQYIVSVLISPHPLLREVAELAKSKDFHFTLLQRAVRLVPKQITNRFVPEFVRRGIKRLMTSPDYPQKVGYR